MARESSNISKTYLDVPGDWKPWITNVKSLAQRDYDIWPLINPTLKEEPTPLEIPLPPAYATYKEGAVTLGDLNEKQEKS